MMLQQTQEKFSKYRKDIKNEIKFIILNMICI